VVGFGILWKVLEFMIHAGSRRVGLSPIIFRHSAIDTASNLVYNLVGGRLVGLFGDRVVSETGLDAADATTDKKQRYRPTNTRRRE
jgi:hypothetical protein